MRPGIHPSFIHAAILLVLAACQGDPQPTPDIPVQVEDSAGVRIVEHTGIPVADAPFRFAAEPLYRHGTSPGDYPFQRINVGRLFPDGSAVISDVGNSELVTLSPEGTRHEVLAGRGEGPGDVSYVSALFVLEQDTLLSIDSRLRRVTAFAGGSVVRMVDIRHAYPFAVQGTGSSGQLLMAGGLWQSGLGDSWLTGHMALFDMDTGTLDTIMSYPLGSSTPPGVPSDPIGTSGNVTVADGRFVYTRSDRPEITWRRTDGTVTQIVRWQAAQAALTDELLEGVEAGIRERNRTANPGAPDSVVDRMTAATWRTIGPESAD